MMIVRGRRGRRRRKVMIMTDVDSTRSGPDGRNRRREQE